MNNNSPTYGEGTAPATKQIERKGSALTPMSRMYPQIRGGQCEFCGVIDANAPAEYQYKLCPHWRGLEMQCSYCDPSKDPNEIIKKSVLNIYDHPTSGEYVVVCDSYECTRAHQARFSRNVG